MSRQLVYLASPYTPLDGESIKDRVISASKAAAKLMKDGYAVFAPVVHSDKIADYMDETLRCDHEFWMAQDLAVLRHCELMFVLRLPGWERSKGVAREIAEAKQMQIPINYINP